MLYLYSGHALTSFSTYMYIQVNGESAWLKEEVEGTAYLPREDGSFDLQDLTPFSTLTVEGPLVVPASTSPSVFRSTGAPSQTISSTPTGSSFLGLAASSSSSPPPFRSVLAQLSLPSFNFKILKATMIRRGRGRAEFSPSSQTYIDLVETTANLEYIMGVIHRRWGSEYILVTNDGLELEDSPATQGW